MKSLNKSRSIKQAYITIIECTAKVIKGSVERITRKERKTK